RVFRPRFLLLPGDRQSTSEILPGQGIHRVQCDRAGQIRETVSFRRERPQDFPPALAAPDLVERGREPCAAFRPHLSNYNPTSLQSATGQTTLLANLARG